MLMALASLSVTAAGNPEAGKEKAAACMGCHGADGNSPTDMWPKLAGQLPEYITKQIHDFKKGTRKNDQMTPMAEALAEVDLPDVAAFFAQQKVKPEAAKPEFMAQGEKIFTKGKGRPAVVPACLGGHGPNGAGNPNWNKTMSKAPVVLAPAIGGQHAAYIAGQLKAYRDGGRKNDVAHVMRDIASRLDDKDIEAVSNYIATLGR
jgi:cytochrome c553